MIDPTNKAELLTRLDEAHGAFVALLAPFDETQLTTSGVNGVWSIKDILAHLTTWQDHSLSILASAQRGETPQFASPTQTDEEIDASNEKAFVANQSRPLTEVQRDFQAAYPRFRAQVAAMSEDELFLPDRFSWRQGSALWENVAGNGYAHYEEHMPAINAWLDHQPERRV